MVYSAICWNPPPNIIINVILHILELMQEIRLRLCKHKLSFNGTRHKI